MKKILFTAFLFSVFCSSFKSVAMEKVVSANGETIILGQLLEDQSYNNSEEKEALKGWYFNQFMLAQAWGKKMEQQETVTAEEDDLLFEVDDEGVLVEKPAVYPGLKSQAYEKLASYLSLDNEEGNDITVFLPSHYKPELFITKNVSILNN